MRHRPERIGSVVQKVVGEAIAFRLSDPRISRFTSVISVQVSKDLHYANVYVSVMGPEGDARATLRGLEAAHGRIQSMVADALPIRTVPILRFRLDESIKRSLETIRLIEQSMDQIRQVEAERAGQNVPAEPAGPDVSAADSDQQLRESQE